MHFTSDKSVEINECNLAVVFKSGISEKTIDEFMILDKLVVCCEVGKKEFLENVPERFIGQVICQMMVTRTNFCMLLKLSEIGLLEVVVIYCKKFYLDEARRETTKNFSSIVS